MKPEQWCFVKGTELLRGPLKGASITPTCYRLCIISFFRLYDLKHNRCVGGGFLHSVRNALHGSLVSYFFCNPLLIPFYPWILFRIVCSKFVFCFPFHVSPAYFFSRRVLSFVFTVVQLQLNPLESAVTTEGNQELMETSIQNHFMRRFLLRLSRQVKSVIDNFFLYRILTYFWCNSLGFNCNTAEVQSNHQK